VDFEDGLIRFTNQVKTPASAKPISLSEYACDVLRAWKKEERKKLQRANTFSRAGSAKPAHLDSKNRLENNTEASGRIGVSDLQLTSRLLHPSQRSSHRMPWSSRAMRHTGPAALSERANKKLNGKRGALHFYVFMTAGCQLLRLNRSLSWRDAYT
jgi:hypothetical protein